MNAEQLSKVGSDLVRRCGTRDPFQIANALGINVMDDCENLGSLKGMYCIVKRNRFIFLNKDLSPQMKRIVCAHEIGHDRLHRALAKNMACRSLCCMIWQRSRSTRQTSLRQRSFLIPMKSSNTLRLRVHLGADCAGNAHRHQLGCFENRASGRNRT